MGLDSVEIIMCLEESLGIAIPDQDAVQLRTPAETIKYLSGCVGAIDTLAFPCLGQRAFHRIRACLIKNNRIARYKISPEMHLRDLLVNRGNRTSWKQFVRDLGLGDLTSILGVPFLGVGSTTIKNIITQTVARRAQLLVSPHERWSCQQLRSIVRASVYDVVGKTDFSDDDEFVADIGIQ